MLVNYATEAVHSTEIRTSISPSSAVDLNTTSALTNYATEAEVINLPAFAWKESEKPDKPPSIDPIGFITPISPSLADQSNTSNAVERKTGTLMSTWEEEVNPHLRRGRAENHPQFTRPRFEPLISPSSAVELNTTSALANYATKAGNVLEMKKSWKGYIGYGMAPNGVGLRKWQKSGKHCPIENKTDILSLSATSMKEWRQVGGAPCAVAWKCHMEQERRTLKTDGRHLRLVGDLTPIGRAIEDVEESKQDREVEGVNKNQWEDWYKTTRANLTSATRSASGTHEGKTY
uniref:Uncharacterized protein n=1 Tax=Timema monikensis TaxID=170555 RepID=A0A7R9EB49_9NEOP|nr:unnamed protein product [Timema monikensis]